MEAALPKVPHVCSQCGTTFIVWPYRLQESNTVYCSRACGYAHRREVHAIPPNFIDLTGQRFGRLTVIELTGRHDWRLRWRCACDCGTIKIVGGDPLRTGRTKSCGCLGREHAANFGSITRPLNTRHGMDGTKEYRAWHSMIQRCYNPRCIGYARYGGRGIAVCDAWRTSFPAFFADMGRAPSPVHSLDRIDNDSGYEPGNCRWALSKRQGRNRSTNRTLTHDGLTLTLAEWSERTGITYPTICKRLRIGWSPDKVLTEPVRDH